MKSSMFTYCRAKADEAVSKVEQLQMAITTRVAQEVKQSGKDGGTALVSYMLDQDRAFKDTVGDRNRYIQLAIMYSNMALLHKE